MDNTVYVALSKQTALWREMQMTANNMANMNTTGYKKSGALFSEYVADTNNDTRFPYDRITYTHDYGTVRDFTEGAFVSTSNPFDLAISGEGYFVVDTKDGERYTRAGKFELDSDGKLVSPNGHALMSENNAPFFFAPEEQNVTIAQDGTVSTENGVVGRIKMMKFPLMQDLREIESGLFVPGSDKNIPEADTTSRVQQGMLESSNVQPVLEMTRMIELHRNFEMVTKMIETEGTRKQKALDTIARKGGNR